MTHPQHPVLFWRENCLLLENVELTSVENPQSIVSAHVSLNDASGFFSLSPFLFLLFLFFSLLFWGGQGGLIIELRASTFLVSVLCVSSDPAILVICVGSPCVHYVSSEIGTLGMGEAVGLLETQRAGEL